MAIGKNEKRILPTLVFNNSADKEIINFLEVLSTQRKLGRFMETLLRAYCENPNGFKSIVNGTDGGGIDKVKDQISVEATLAIKDMQSKVDGVYEMCRKMYTESMFGKRIGIEEKSVNTLAAQFILQRQLDELESLVGVKVRHNAYASDKVEDTKKKCDEVLEYIINNHAGIVNEMRPSNEVRVAVSVPEVAVSVPEVAVSVPEVAVSVPEVADEILDMGDAPIIKKEESYDEEDVEKILRFMNFK